MLGSTSSPDRGLQDLAKQSHKKASHKITGERSVFVLRNTALPEGKQNRFIFLEGDRGTADDRRINASGGEFHTVCSWFLILATKVLKLILDLRTKISEFLGQRTYIQRVPNAIQGASDMTTISNSALFESCHAAQRRNQRGIKVEVINLILMNYDLEIPRGGGCSMLRISRTKVAALCERGFSCQLVDAAARHAVLINGDFCIVTTAKIYDGKRGRPYRRAENGRRFRMSRR